MQIDKIDGHKVRRLRKLRGWYGADLAAAVGRTTDFIYRIERNKKHPSPPTALLIAQALDTTVEELLIDTEDPKGPEDSLQEPA